MAEDGRPDDGEIRRGGRRLKPARIASIVTVAVIAAGLAGALLLLTGRDPPPITDRAPPGPTPRAADHREVEGCDPPPLAPTYLPWLDDGAEVSEPVAVRRGTADSPHGSLVWAEDADAYDPVGPNLDYVSISTLYDDEQPEGTREQIDVRGHAADLIWVGDPGAGELRLIWREAVNPCGTYSISLLVSGSPDYLDAPDQAAIDAAEGEARDGLMHVREQAVETEIVRIAESLADAPRTRRGQWQPLPDAPVDGRASHIAVWTGEQMLVWGGATLQEMGTHPDLHATGASYDPETGEMTPIGERHFETAAAYNPDDRSWTSLARSPIEGSFADTGVWTGHELLVLNGRGDGAAYRPDSDRWRLLPALPVPIAGDGHTAVWTATEMIVWRYRCTEDGCDTAGAAYEPEGDAWRVIAAAPLGPRRWHTAVWTGTEMIVWGGTSLDDRTTPGPSGAAYDPAADNWRVIAEAPIPTRQWHTATWTGDEIIVIGGLEETPRPPPLSGGAYDPASDSWRKIATAPVEGRWWHSATWTGTGVVVWGGYDNGRPFGDGAVYDPAANTWEPLPATALAGRCHHTAVADDRSVLVWGGTSSCGKAGDRWQADGALFRRP